VLSNQNAAQKLCHLFTRQIFLTEKFSAMSSPRSPKISDSPPSSSLFPPDSPPSSLSFPDSPPSSLSFPDSPESPPKKFYRIRFRDRNGRSTRMTLDADEAKRIEDLIETRFITHKQKISLTTLVPGFVIKMVEDDLNLKLGDWFLVNPARSAGDLKDDTCILEGRTNCSQL